MDISRKELASLVMHWRLVKKKGFKREYCGSIRRKRLCLKGDRDAIKPEIFLRAFDKDCFWHSHPTDSYGELSDADLYCLQRYKHSRTFLLCTEGILMFTIAFVYHKGYTEVKHIQKETIWRPAVM